LSFFALILRCLHSEIYYFKPLHTIRLCQSKKFLINDFPRYAENMGFTIIDMQEKETITFHELPLKKNHKDPFDRMLIWQAITKNMTMISKDKLFEQYKKDGLKLIW